MTEPASRRGLLGRRNDADRVAWVSAELAEVPPGARLLDVGAGELRFKPMSSHLRYVSQDFGRYDGRGDAKGLQTGTFDQSGVDLISDITAIPEPDGSFDAVLCTEVLEHVPDPLRAVREIARLLRPGGRLILTAPFVSFTHFSPFHFCTGFSRYWYEYWLPRLGLRIVKLEPAARDGFYEFLSQEMLRVPTVWSSYGRVNSLVRTIGRAILAISAFPLWAGLVLAERWSADSTDLCTYRWCCVAERVHDQRSADQP